MPIDPNFIVHLRVTGNIRQENNDIAYLIWGPGKLDEASQNEDVIISYQKHKETIEPLGVHGTNIAVDWDSCVAQGNCMDACPVQVFQWYRTEKNIPAIQVHDVKFSGTGSIKRTKRTDFSDKAQPIREKDCTFCNACQPVCPTSAIKITCT